jgi:hypothetical protein
MEAIKIKVRRKQIELLMKGKKQQENDAFERRQKRNLMFLKKMAEKVYGGKVIQKCYEASADSNLPSVFSLKELEEAINLDEESNMEKMIGITIKD